MRQKGTPMKKIGIGILALALLAVLLPASAYAAPTNDRSGDGRTGTGGNEREYKSEGKWFDPDNPEEGGWINNGDGTWTYSFGVFDDTAEYYLWEEEMNGYISNIPIDPGYIIINKDGSHTGTLKNTSSDKGSLMLTKFVDGDGLTMVDGGTEIVTVAKYSHTPNVDDDGTKKADYANSYTQNEVVTIPGAKKLHVKVVYGGESATYDYVCLWSGSHPTYTAAENQNAAEFIAKLGGGSHTAASNTKEYDISGDSVTFAFRSDGSSVGDGYGYYAVVTADVEVESQYAAGDFDFTIKLEPKDPTDTATAKALEGKKVFDGVVFTDGVAHVKLHDKQTLKIDGLPEGVKYEITEGANANYEMDSSGEKGEIESGETKVSIFRNTYIPPETNDQLYNVTLAKVEEGAVEEAGTYEFFVELTGLEPSQEYKLSNGDTFTSRATGEADITVEIKGGKQVAIYGLPEGATYRITEAAGDYTASYKVTKTGSEGRIAKSTDSNETANEALTTATETVDAGEDVTVTFTNRIERTQKLTIKKEAEGLFTDENSEFNFTIAFSDMPPGTKLYTEYGVINEDDGTAERPFVLHPGDELVIEDIPVGVKWKVTEAGSNYTATYTVEGKDGKVVSGSGTNDGKVNTRNGNLQDLSTKEETVDVGEDGVVTFRNVLRTSDLTVGKTIKGSMADKTKEFTFTVKAEYDGKDITGNFPAEDENGDEIAGGVTFDGNGVATFTLGHDEKIKIKGLPVGTSYTVTETAENYTATSTYSASRRLVNEEWQVVTGESGAVVTSTILPDGMSKADYTNTLDVAVPTDGRTGRMVTGILIALGAVIGLAAYAGKKRRGVAGEK